MAPARSELGEWLNFVLCAAPCELAQAMGRSLGATLLFDYPTIHGLAGYLLELALPQRSDASERVETVAASGLEAELAKLENAWVLQVNDLPAAWAGGG